jgi:hypothetical protein
MPSRCGVQQDAAHAVWPDCSPQGEDYNRTSLRHAVQTFRETFLDALVKEVCCVSLQNAMRF